MKLPVLTHQSDILAELSWTYNPINMRSPQLRPLCKEHLDGIDFVRRIRYGMEKTSLTRLREYILWYWSNHIRQHLFQEEKILLPYFSPENPLSVKIKDDHSYIRELILAIDLEADMHTMKVLCDMIIAHIHFEEVKVYPYLEKHLTEKELNNIFQCLESNPVPGNDWNDSSWDVNDIRGNLFN